MSFIGVDIGTSFIKGGILDLEARQLKGTRRVAFPEPLASPNPLLCEFNPKEIVNLVGNLLHELLRDVPDCSGIVMSGQQHGLILVDERGEIRSNCLTWRDQRALMPHPSGKGTYFDLLAERITSEQKRQLGNELRVGLPVCFLFWFAEQGQLADRLTPISIPEFVVTVLSGSPPSVDVTNGGPYGLLNLETSNWHHEVIQQLGLDRLRWPPIRRHGEITGYLKTGSKSVPFYTPVGDYPCSLAGALISSEELSLNISTGSQLSRLTQELNLGDYQTRPFFDGKFLNTFTHIPAGRSLTLLVEVLSELATAQGVALPDPWAYIARAAADAGDTDLQVDITFFACPYGDRGTVSNIRGDNFTVGHLFRAAFKHMTDNYYSLAQRLWPDRSWRNLVFSGGLPFKFEVLRQVIKEKFQSDYRMSPSSEDTLLGLLVLALAFSGRVASAEQAMNELRSSQQTWD